MKLVFVSLILPVVVVVTSIFVNDITSSSKKVADALLAGEFARKFLIEERNMRSILRIFSGNDVCKVPSGITIWRVYHKRINDNIADDKLRGIRVAGNVVNSICDFDVAKYTKLLGPDSFYQTIMSEHSALIVMGLMIDSLHTINDLIGTCSWKAALKGRPIPCQNFQLLNGSFSLFTKNNMVIYWGPSAGPLKSLHNYQLEVSKVQPDQKNYMGDMIKKFFVDIFQVDKNSNPSSWAIVSKQGPSLLWSNYFVTTPYIWSMVGKFDFIAASWLDLNYPRNVTSDNGCPKNYKSIEKSGFISTHRVDEECHYCRNSVWTNWHRCKFGCHRCWSYVMEQLNVIFFSVLTNRMYIHDDSACDSTGIELMAASKQDLSSYYNFNFEYINSIYNNMRGV